MSNHWANTSWKNSSKSKNFFFESGLLRLNCNKAKRLIKWKSILKFDELTLMVVDWYSNYYLNKKNASQITYEQIKKYQYLSVKRGSGWAKI